MRHIRFTAFALFALLIIACKLSGPERLPAVEALRAPSLPSWITSVSPVGPATSLTQIRLLFAKDVAPLSAVADAASTDILSHLSLEPNLPGNFVLLTPRMIGFVPQRALPAATRIRVTLSAGARDLSGDVLAHDLRWTFQSTPIALTDLPQASPSPDSDSIVTPAPLHPAIRISSNTPLDLASLASHAVLVAAGTDTHIGLHLRAPKETPTPNARERFDASARTYSYVLEPSQTLAHATTYVLRIGAGVLPRDGNLATSGVATGSFRTFAPLKILPGTSLGNTDNGRFANGDPGITFNNALDPTSLKGAVTFSPDLVAPNPDIVGNDPRVLAINPYLLSPDVTYSVTISTAVHDVFGQHLDHAMTQTFHTGNFASGIWAPSGTAIFPSEFSVGLNTYATNLPRNQYHAAFIPVTLAMLLARGAESSNYGPLGESQKAWPVRSVADAKPNVQSIVPVPMTSLLNAKTGMLAYGIGANLGADNNPKFSGLVQMTNIGLFAQIFPSSGVVRATSLSDGSALAGVRIDLHAVSEQHPETGAKPLCASGVTGADGAFHLSAIDLERCTARSIGSSDRPPSLLVVARSGSDWTWTALESYSGIYNYNIYGGWASGAPLSRGVLYPDRDLYKPGESGELSGIAYIVLNDAIRPVPHAKYAITIADPDGKNVLQTTTTTDGYGVFSLPLTLSKNAQLGYYGVTAKGPLGDTIFASYRVAEFRAPNFKLDLAFSSPAIVAGATQQATAIGSYLFGGALSGAKAVISVTRDLATLAPSGYDDFSFGRQWFWPQRQPSFDTSVSQSSQTFDATGKLVASVAVPSDLAFPMTYTVDVNATDASNLSVDTTQTFTALADPDIIGLSSDALGTAGSPLSIKTVVVTPDGKAAGTRSIHLELQKATFAAATQLIGGGDSADESVTYATVDSADAQAGSTPVNVTLHPKDGGIYRIRATFSGASNAAAATDLQVWVAGPTGNFLTQNGDQTVAVKLDQKQYKIGDTAVALVQSPFRHARVTLEILRNSILVEKVVDCTGSSVRIPFTVTPSMLPNAALMARVVRVGRPLAQLGSADVPASLMRIGMTGLRVDVSGRLLKVTVMPLRPTVEPGGKQTVTFALSSSSGKPVAGELVVSIVNDAVLQLTGYRPPKLLDAIYAEQPISTRFSENGSHVVTQMAKAPQNKGWGYGGGFLGGAADARIRRTFTPLAYYSAHVRTDDSGHAIASFTLPDDLTTWRVMAVALDRSGSEAGNADATFIATKKLITNPLLPQFARPGDQIDGGISIRNATSTAANATVTLTTSGALRFVTGDAKQQTSTQRVDVGMQALRFPMVIGTPAPSTLTVRSSLDGDSDAFEVPLEIRDRAVTQTAFDAGTTDTQVTLPIGISPTATLDLTLANTAVPGFLVQASDALKASEWPFADDASGRLVIDTMLKRQVSDDLAMLAALHRSDGGFSYTPSDGTSDPYATAAVLDALAFAKAHGVDISAIPIDSTLAYARSILNDPTRFSYCKSQLCRARTRFEMLASLSDWGERQTAFLDEIVRMNAQFDDATRMHLARYLLATPGYRSTGQQLAKHYLDQTHVSGRFATVNVANPWSWLGSDIQAQAQFVRLLVASGASRDVLDAGIRSLGSMPCKCGWGGIDGTAAALRALAAYQRVAIPHALHVDVRSGTATLASVDIPNSPASKALTIAASSLTESKLDLAVRGGTLDYVVTITAQVPSDAPGALAGIRVTRMMTALGSMTPIVTFDLNPLTAPVSVPATHVYDIGVRIIVDRPLDRIAIDDALPAGFEAIDSAFQTSPQAASEIADAWQIADRQIYADRVTAYAPHLDPGVYEMHYLVRSITPGTYRWPGARAYVRGAPEIFGRSSSGVVTVTQ